MMTCHVLRMLLAGIEGLRVDYITFRADELGRRATLRLYTDEETREVCRAIGVEPDEYGDDKGTWLWAETTVDGITLVVTGPERARVRLGVVQ